MNDVMKSAILASTILAGYCTAAAQTPDGKPHPVEIPSVSVPKGITVQAYVHEGDRYFDGSMQDESRPEPDKWVRASVNFKGMVRDVTTWVDVPEIGFHQGFTVTQIPAGMYVSDQTELAVLGVFVSADKSLVAVAPLVGRDLKLSAFHRTEEKWKSVGEYLLYPSTVIQPVVGFEFVSSDELDLASLGIKLPNLPIAAAIIKKKGNNANPHRIQMWQFGVGQKILPVPEELIDTLNKVRRIYTFKGPGSKAAQRPKAQ